MTINPLEPEKDSERWAREDVKNEEAVNPGSRTSVWFSVQS